MAILKYFKCKGSIGVFYGLGLEEIAINFENMSGLVTLAGKNGHGKTTVMEMLSPFDVFKSRQIKDPKKYNLKKQFMLRDSYKEVCYQFNGKEHIFRVEIPAGTKSTAPEGYITCDGVPLVKGKITEYRKKVVELFGSEDLFYSSIFSCQGGPKLTDKTVGEFKQLLIELLGLSKYTAWWHSAGKVLKAVNIELDKTVADLSRFDEKISEMEESKSELNDLNFILDADKLAGKKIKESIDLLEFDIKELQKQKSEAGKKEAVCSEKTKQKKSLELELKKLRESNEFTISDHEVWVTAKSDEIAQSMSTIAQKEQIVNADAGIKAIEAEKQEWTAGISTLDKQMEVKQTKIDEVVEELSKLSLQVSDLKEDEESKILLGNIEDTKEEYVKAKSVETTKHADLYNTKDQSVLRTLEQSLEQFNAAEELLNKRPDNCVDDSCPFIMSALESIKQKPEKENAIISWKEQNKTLVNAAQKELTDAEEKVSEVIVSGTKAKRLWQERYDIITTSIKSVNDTITIQEQHKIDLVSILHGFKTKKIELSGYIEKIPGRTKSLQKLADLKPDLKTAEKLVEVSNKVIAEKETGFNNSQREFAVKVNASKIEIENLEEHLSIEFVSSELIDDGIRIKNNSVLALESDIVDIDLKILNTEKKIAVLEDKSKLPEDDQKKIDSLTAQEKHIRKEITKWEYVRAAVSKSGLQALEIASAAPLLTGIANDLLDSAFGGEFFVDLVTIDPETGSEVLDIVITREDGNFYPLADFSGGESVYILQAFKCAQIVVNTEKSGVHFQTCFADEESGSLDREKAERFVKMYRALMERAGFEKLFFISHIPECQAMADHGLMFQKGGIVSESDIEMVV